MQLGALFYEIRKLEVTNRCYFWRYILKLEILPQTGITTGIFEIKVRYSFPTCNLSSSISQYQRNVGKAKW